MNNHQAKISQKVISRFGGLLDNGLGSDVLIKVGEEPNVKKYHVHSVVLMAVSSYFRAAFSNTWMSKVNGIILFEKQNVPPKIFEMILRFIYKADLDLKKQKVSDICSLIYASDELNIDILNEHIFEYFTQDSRRLIHENPAQILHIIFQLDIFSSLRDKFLRIICENPNILMNSVQFYALDKSILIRLLKRDDLAMEEVRIWIHLLDWAIYKIQDKLDVKEVEKWKSNDFALLKYVLKSFIPHIRLFQIPGKDYLNLLLDWVISKTQDELDVEEVEKWKSNDFALLKYVLEDFVPHIRWFQIPGKAFWYNVKPFRAVLPEDLYDDILGYHIDKTIKPRSSVILPKRKKNPRVIGHGISN